MEKVQRRFGVGIELWIRKAAGEEGCTRSSLERALRGCELAQREGKALPGLGSAGASGFGSESERPASRAAFGLLLGLVRCESACKTDPSFDDSEERGGETSGCRGPKRRIWVRPLVGDWREDLIRPPVQPIGWAPEPALPDGTGWTAREYVRSAHPDVRIRDRIAKMGAAWEKRPGRTIPEMFRGGPGAQGREPASLRPGGEHGGQ